MKFTLLTAALIAGALALPLTVAPEVQGELDRLNAPEPWEKRSYRKFFRFASLKRNTKFKP